MTKIPPYGPAVPPPTPKERVVPRKREDPRPAPEPKKDDMDFGNKGKPGGRAR